MITTGPFRLTFRFEHWTPIVGVDPLDPTGTNLKITGYNKADDSVGMVIPVQGGFSLVTRQQMNIDDEVRNIRDRAGQVLTSVGGATYNMFVSAVEPVLNPFGVVVGYKHSLRRAA